MHTEKHTVLHIKFPYFCLILIGIYWQILVQVPGIKSHESPFSSSWAVHADRWAQQHLWLSLATSFCDHFKNNLQVVGKQNYLSSSVQISCGVHPAF
jgi:hypothetical protein